MLIGEEQGWKDYVMRLFTVEPGGYSPRHDHDWPHIIYVVEGEGSLYLDGKDLPVRAGSVAFVDGGEEHQLSQRGAKKFVFMCIVPPEGDV